MIIETITWQLILSQCKLSLSIILSISSKLNTFRCRWSLATVIHKLYKNLLTLFLIWKKALLSKHIRNQKKSVVQLPAYVQLFCIPWILTPWAPLSMGFPRQKYWSRLPFSSPGDFPNLGIEPVSPALAGGFFTTEPPGKPKRKLDVYYYYYA